MAKPFHKSEMALVPECAPNCVSKVLNAAGDFMDVVQALVFCRDSLNPR